VEDFGGDILYVPNRCILCTRCVRFMEHAAKDDVLNVSERGDRAVIGIHPDRQMDHPWAGNVVDLCPVGSLLSKDFLHRARAWELDKTASVCPGCSQGCNVNLDTRNNAVVRLRPRVNLEVNRYFMCDLGRTQYRWMNRGDRIEAPLLGGNEFTAVDWDHVLDRAVQLIKGGAGKAVILASPGVSNEALFLAKQVLADFAVTAAFRVERVPGEAPLAGVPNLALRGERAANVTGAVLLGYREAFDQALRAAADSALVLVLDDGLDGVPASTFDAPNLVFLGTRLPEVARRARIVLPITNLAEEDGTFVNRDRRVQRFFQAKAAPGMARPSWWVLGEILRGLGRGDALASADEAFDLLAQSEPVFSGLSYASLGLKGVVLPAAATAGVPA
jgi:NADH-quinone oxidoreductase subunit G